MHEGWRYVLKLQDISRHASLLGSLRVANLIHNLFYNPYTAHPGSQPSSDSESLISAGGNVVVLSVGC